MAKENYKIFLCLFAYILVVSTQDVLETDDLSRSFTFAAVVNTSSSLADSEDEILARHSARSAVHCAHKCLTNKQCEVIGFNAKSGVCWLMKSAGRNGLLKSQDIVILTKAGFEKASEEKVEEFSSCKEVMEKGRSKGNGIYNIKTNQTSTTRTYCHMDKLPDCGGGGWTLTMKINGSKGTFNYDSPYWTDRQALKTENGLGLEEEESKLPTYWSTTLTKICLGMKMKTNSDIKWLKLELKQWAASLYNVITTGYPAEPYTLLGVNKWKDTFMPESPDANYIIADPKEGVSFTWDNYSSWVYGIEVRLGILDLEDRFPAYFGFGTWGSWHETYGINVSCGYGREYGSPPYYLKKTPFCYILVQ